MISFGLDLGGLASMGNQQLATMIAWQQLQWQKQQARKQERFAQASRGDVFGNEQYYDPLLNKWIVKLTPMQEAIIRAQEREQRLQMTEDAARNREVRRAAGERARQARADYNVAQAGYRYDQPPSEKAIAAEIAGLMAGAKEENARRGQTELTRQLLRSGRGALLPHALRMVNQVIGGDISQTLFDARKLAVEEAAKRTQAHQQKYLPALEYFAKIMDAGGTAPIQYSQLPQQKAQEQGEMADLIRRVMDSTAKNVGSAYSDLIGAAGKSVNLGNIGFSMPGMRSGGRDNSYPLIDYSNNSSLF